MMVVLSRNIIDELRSTIKVVGIGGAGSNAINRMIAVGLPNVEFIAVDTDPQTLELSMALSSYKLRLNQLKVCAEEWPTQKLGGRQRRKAMRIWSRPWAG